jgi:hypothetical protein
MLESQRNAPCRNRTYNLVIKSPEDTAPFKDAVVLGRRRTRAEGRWTPHDSSPTRVCVECTTEKPLEDFYKNKGAPHSRCKVCYAEMQRRYRKSEKGQATLRRIRKAQKADPVVGPQVRASHRIRSAVARGSLVRGECSKAGASPCKGQIDGHHADYAKPNEVTWLCRKHHFEEHGHKVGRKRKAA